ncbi:Rho GTPase activating protein [Saitoella coloradoensis]
MSAHPSPTSPSSFVPSPTLTSHTPSTGSTSDLLTSLQKENTSLSSQNKQLWKLVDKQRAMILALRGDLERVGGEREKLRERVRGFIKEERERGKEVEGLLSPALESETRRVVEGSEVRGETVTVEDTIPTTNFTAPIEAQTPPLPSPPTSTSTPMSAGPATGLTPASNKRRPTPLPLMTTTTGTPTTTRTTTTSTLMTGLHAVIPAPPLSAIVASSFTNEGEGTPAPRTRTRSATVTGSSSTSSSRLAAPPTGYDTPLAARRDRGRSNEEEDDEDEDEDPFHSPLLSARKFGFGQGIGMGMNGLLSPSNLVGVTEVVVSGDMEREQGPIGLGLGLGSGLGGGSVVVDAVQQQDVESEVEKKNAGRAGVLLDLPARISTPGLPRSPRDGIAMSMSPPLPAAGTGNPKAEVASLASSPPGTEGILSPVTAREHLSPNSFTTTNSIHTMSPQTNSAMSTPDPSTQFIDPDSLLLTPDSMSEIALTALALSTTDPDAPVPSSLMVDIGVLDKLNSTLKWVVRKSMLDVCDISGLEVDVRSVGGWAVQKSMLEGYLRGLLRRERGALMGICEFLSTDVIERGGVAATTIGVDTAVRGGEVGRKEGWLSKKSKGFGGWKSRWFVLEGGDMRYYDKPGGTAGSAIRLAGAQIARQATKDVSKENVQDEKKTEGKEGYKHAFMILESKKVRHILCANSDEEREEWIRMLLQHIDLANSTLPLLSEKSEKEKEKVKKASKTKQGRHASANEGAHVGGMVESESMRSMSSTSTRRDDDFGTGLGRPVTRESVLGMSYDRMVQGQRPSPHSRSKSVESVPLLPIMSPILPEVKVQGISGPTNATVITDGSQWGNIHVRNDDSIKANDDRKATDKRTKKKSFWGFGHSKTPQRTSSDASTNSTPPAQRRGGHGPVFGVTLEEAIAVSRPVRDVVLLPNVVYRCIEYLEAKNAVLEEGIYRLSGSSSVVKMLKDKFDKEGDAELLGAKEMYDVHAVAGLLKLYLRELPVSVLTRELHVEFLQVIGEVDDLPARTREVNRLVHRLPPPNFSLLRVLCAHLIRVVENSNVNKMTVRNVGIVFSPTLNIPAGVLTLFLGDFEGVFVEDVDAPADLVPNYDEGYGRSNQEQYAEGQHDTWNQGGLHVPTSLRDDRRSQNRHSHIVGGDLGYGNGGYGGRLHNVYE